MHIILRFGSLISFCVCVVFHLECGFCIFVFIFSDQKYSKISRMDTGIHIRKWHYFSSYFSIMAGQTFSQISFSVVLSNILRCISECFLQEGCRFLLFLQIQGCNLSDLFSVFHLHTLNEWLSILQLREAQLWMKNVAIKKEGTNCINYKWPVETEMCYHITLIIHAWGFCH